VKIISLTKDNKIKIPPVKMKNHVSRISCQNFSLIWRLTKRKSSFYQEDAILKNWVASSTKKWCSAPKNGTQCQSIRKNERWTLPCEA